MPSQPLSTSSTLSLDELKRFLDKTLATDDEFLEGLLEAAFLQAQAPPPHGCGRVLAPDPPLDTDPPVERRIAARGHQRVLVPDAREITDVDVDGTAVTDWAVGLIRDGLLVQIELPELEERPSVCTLTGRFGFVEIPRNLRNAIYILAARAFHERDAAYADQVAVAEVGGVQSYYRQLPPAVKLAFASYALPCGLLTIA